VAQEEILADLLEASARRTPDQARADLRRARRNPELRRTRPAGRCAGRLAPDRRRRAARAIVGLWLPRGIELLVMQAGIAKTGAAWLPVDQDTPVERLQVCLDDAAAIGVVTCELLAPQLAGVAPPGLDRTKRCWSRRRRRGNACARGPVSPDAPAYVIYTSGSTGKPKGILITQRSICHFLRSENQVLGIRADDRVYQGFSVAFDMSFEEIWIAYLVGATLWIGPKEIAATRNPAAHAGRQPRHGAARGADPAGAVREEVPACA
jgi:non-ribosomal peptide synthetase component F